MTDEQVQVTVERIWLEGEEALLPIQPNAEDSVRYRVPGLDSSLEIKDYRAAGRVALKAASTREGYRDFPSNFDSPALITIQSDGCDTIIELREPTDAHLKTCDVLWIAARVDESLPVWPMAWHIQSEPQGDRQSFVAILE